MSKLDLTAREAKAWVADEARRAVEGGRIAQRCADAQAELALMAMFGLDKDVPRAAGALRALITKLDG